FFTIFFDTNYYKENMFSVLKTVFMFLNYSNLWFAAWLSVFYCIKVASYTQSSFIWLKQRLASLVPWMLITSSLYSIACTIPFTWAMCCRNNNYTAPLSTANSSETGVTSKDNLKLLIFLCNASIALPFILSVASSILLIRSLWIHTRQMQNNATGFRDPSLEAHMRAIKSVCSVLVLYIIYFISVLLIVFKVFEPLSTEEAVCIVVMAACPAVHAMILIWSNPK
ncbi:PREDICTED: taste receptor type 2 member 40-like, partial [Acanthisitta chloris]|uniref:taste receptor type 2 member 40-like n=1 Tax=Acanthisitta chloris TaxID=57068 RepID=UPI0004F0E07A